MQAPETRPRDGEYRETLERSAKNEAMNWQVKRIPVATPTAMGPGPKAAVATASNARASNCLKEFLWLLSDVEKGKLLDLGQVSQQTLNFFINKGFRVSTEDFLRSWREYLAGEEERLRKAVPGADAERPTTDQLATRFLDDILQYPAETFHGILAWDLFDYMEPELLARAVERLHEIIRPGGLVLALFHSRPPVRYSRYRIFDDQSIELLAAPPLAPHVHVFQNREVLDLFGKFRSSKSFVGRDQMREGLFLK